jgi:hypothetical protein
LGVELSGRRNRPVVVALAVLIAGIVVTSALDLRDLRHKPDEGLDERVELRAAPGRVGRRDAAGTTGSAWILSPRPDEQIESRDAGYGSIAGQSDPGRRKAGSSPPRPAIWRVICGSPGLEPVPSCCRQVRSLPLYVCCRVRTRRLAEPWSPPLLGDLPAKP